MSKGIIEIVNPGIASNLTSYWAMHFVSLLEALYEHKQLQYSFTKTIPLQYDKTLSQLSSHAEHSFFSKIRNSITNWGLQYFLCHYLMSIEGEDILIKLLGEISNNYNYDLIEYYEDFGVFVCGIDSFSGETFLRTTDAHIFGYNESTIANVWEDIKYVDLCILVRSSTLEEPDIAVFGEVEGNNTMKIFRESFWNKKSSFCAFGIGVNENQNNITIQNIETFNGIKTILILGSEFLIIEDFKIAIGILETFFAISPHHVMQFVNGQRDIVCLIRDYWHKPVIELIGLLRGMIQVTPLATLGTNALSMQSIPKIII